MITRNDYMKDPENLHQSYYYELGVAGGIKGDNIILLKRVKKAYKNGDYYLNTINLGLWDYLYYTFLKDSPQWRKACKDRGEGNCLGSGVCALKAVYREWFR